MISKDFNFIPYEIIKVQKSRQKANMIFLLAILFVVSALSLLLIPYNQVKRLESQKAAYEAGIESIKDIESYERLLTLENQKLTLYKSFLGQVTDNEKVTIEMLETIEEVIPKEAFLTSVTVTETSLTLGGNAKSNLILADFIRSLKLTGLFDDVFLPSLDTGIQSTEGIDFSLDCTIKAR